MKQVSKATLQRYPVYLKALRKLKSLGVKRVMSKELAEYVDIQPTTIRRDFSLIGHLGKQGFGYDVDELIEIFSSSLGINFDEKIILVGAGNLGKALLKYNNWDNVIGEIVCAFDKYPDKVGISKILKRKCLKMPASPSFAYPVMYKRRLIFWQQTASYRSLI